MFWPAYEFLHNVFTELSTGFVGKSGMSIDFLGLQKHKSIVSIDSVRDVPAQLAEDALKLAFNRYAQ